MSTTLWGECSGNEQIGVGQIIAIKGAKTSSYGGVSLNVDDSSSHITVNPTKVEKYASIRKWYMQNQGKGAIPTESLTQMGGAESSINMAQLPYSSIMQMNEVLINN